MTGTVYAIRGNAIEVRAPEGTFSCRARGKAKRERGREVKLCAVGDRVEFSDAGAGEGVVERVLPRRNRLSRRDPASPARELVIVANLDALLVVVAAKNPDLDLLTVDKCLLLGAAGGVPCAIVVNKMDLAPAGTAERVEGYRRIGLRVFLASAATGEGIEALREAIRGRTVSLVGPSGVGKSSLANALCPGLKLRTGEVSLKRGTGRHTTTAAAIIDHADGRIVDTPGMEFFVAWGVTPANLKAHFPEFEAYAPKCRFRDCGHGGEPKCAVAEAATSGAIPAARYANYRAIRAMLQDRGGLFEPS